MSGNRKYILIMVGCLALLSLAEYLAPKPIDWRVSLSKDDKIPYGNYILRQMLGQQVAGQPVTDNYQTLYELATADRKSDTVALAKNLIFINNTFAPDSLDALALLNYAYSGSTVFIAANYFGGYLADTLSVEVLDNVYLKNEGVVKELLDSLGTNFSNPRLRAPKPYFYRRGIVSQYFAGADTATVVLGTNSLGAANFVKIRYGQGGFLLHCNPLAFTNYNMLHPNNNEYIAKALTYLPAQPVVWDEYYKTGRKELSSPFRFLLENEALAWSWRLLLGTVLLYVLFAAKRRQRIIPIVRPPMNTTLEFARTIGRLYYLHGDHHDLAHKKTAYFMETLRTHFYLSTSGVYPFGPDTMDQLCPFMERVAHKTNVPLAKIKALLDAMLTAERSPNLSEAQLIRLNQLIEQFYEEAGLGNRA
jgi:hypothetical protein